MIKDTVFNYDRNYVAMFNHACDEVIQSKYIIAEGKISALLQTIAGNKYLYEFFKNAVDGYDFAREYKKSLIANDSRYSLALPTNPVKLTAYVFCLLLDFDTRQMLLKDFLHDVFYSELGANVEYERFVIDIIVPFKRCVNKLLNEKDEPEQDPSVEEVFRSLSSILTETGAPSEELNFLLAALKRAVQTEDRLLAQVAFIGSKNTAKALDVLTKIAEPMEKLRIYLIDNGFLR